MTLTCSIEDLPNIRPAAHGVNVIELEDGSLFAIWYCGTYEGAEDQRIAGSIKKVGQSWEHPNVIVARFALEGEAWIPEIGVPLPNSNGDMDIFFWASTLSSFSLQGDEPRWIRSIPRARLFSAALHQADKAAGARRSFLAEEPKMILPEEGLIFQGAALKLSSGRWVLPFHTEREDLLFHSKFLVSDDEGKSWEVRADIYAEPGCLEPSLVQLPSGEVLCYMRRGGKRGHVWRAVSYDDCETFSEPLQTNLRNPHSAIDIAVGISGKFLIAFNDSYWLRTPLCVGLSEDVGETFKVRDVEVAEGEYSYPKLLQTHDDLWHLFYTCNRKHIRHAWFEEGWLEGGRKMIGLDRDAP